MVITLYYLLATVWLVHNFYTYTESITTSSTPLLMQNYCNAIMLCTYVYVVAFKRALTRQVDGCDYASDSTRKSIPIHTTVQV